MFEVFVTAVGILLVSEARSDTEKVIGGAVLAAALNSAFRKAG